LYCDASGDATAPVAINLVHQLERPSASARQERMREGEVACRAPGTTRSISARNTARRVVLLAVASVIYYVAHLLVRVAVAPANQTQAVADLRDVFGHRRRAARLLPFGTIDHCRRGEMMKRQVFRTPRSGGAVADDIGYRVHRSDRAPRRDPPHI